MRPVSRLLIGSILLLVATGLVAAQGLEGQTHESRVLSDKFQIGMGGFLADFTTDAAVGLGGVLGTTIRLEDTRQWRFKRRHALAFATYRFSRSGVTVLDEEFEFEGITYGIDADLAMTFDSDVYALTYRYSFINNGKTEAGVSAGLATFKYGIDVEGEVNVGDPNNPTTEIAAASESLLAPVPNFGMYINHAFNPNWILRLSASFLNLNVSDYEGKLTQTRATVDWYFARHVGIGAGLASSNLKFTKSGDDPWSVDYRYSGFLFYVSGVF